MASGTVYLTGVHDTSPVALNGIVNTTSANYGTPLGILMSITRTIVTSNTLIPVPLTGTVGIFVAP